MAKTYLDPVGWSAGTYSDPVSWGDEGTPAVIQKFVSDAGLLIGVEAPMVGAILSVADGGLLIGTDSAVRIDIGATTVKNVTDTGTIIGIDTATVIIGTVPKNVTDSGILIGVDSASRTIIGNVIKNVTDSGILIGTDSASASELTPTDQALFFDNDARVQIQIESDAKMGGVILG